MVGGNKTRPPENTKPPQNTKTQILGGKGVLSDSKNNSPAEDASEAGGTAAGRLFVNLDDQVVRDSIISHQGTILARDKAQQKCLTKV